MSGKRPAYRSYLLRLWRASDGDLPIWRASLEDPHTGERRGFAGLEQLFAFLDHELGISAGAPATPAETAGPPKDDAGLLTS
jgi:hypothetical protein